MEEGDAGVCQEPLRQAFLELLRWALLCVRNESTDSRFCYLHADHVHNLPDLLADFHPDRFAYYWEVERPVFLHNLKAIGRRPPDAFDRLWVVVEREYRNLNAAGR